MPYVTEGNLTDVVLERWKDIPNPRLRQIMQSLIKHLHAFVREVEPTQVEWATGIDWRSSRLNDRISITKGTSLPALARCARRNGRNSSWHPTS